MSSTNLLISMKAAARLAGMQYDTFRSYVNDKRVPVAQIIDDRPFFDSETIKKWKPVKLKTGRKAEDRPAL